VTRLYEAEGGASRQGGGLPWDTAAKSL
jgi:hypothetical protein